MLTDIGGEGKKFPTETTFYTKKLNKKQIYIDTHMDFARLQERAINFIPHYHANRPVFLTQLCETEQHVHVQGGSPIAVHYHNFKMQVIW